MDNIKRAVGDAGTFLTRAVQVKLHIIVFVFNILDDINDFLEELSHMKST